MSSRFYNRKIAASVTQNGVWLLQETIAAAVSKGMRVVYGDTDSLFVTGVSEVEFGSFVEWCNATLYPELLAKQGCAHRNAIKLAYEKAFERVVFTAAKKYCNPPEAPIWMGDLSFKPLGEIRVGDEVMGWDDSAFVSKSKRRVLVKSTVAAVHRHIAPIVKVTFASGRVVRCTADHRWLHARRSTKCNSQFVTPKVGRSLAHVVDMPRQLTHAEEVEASWLGGIFDGEGSLCSSGRGQITISQSEKVNPEICARIRSSLRGLGFDYHEWHAIGNVQTFAVRGRRQARLNFLAWCRPAKGHKIAAAIVGHRFTTPDKIVKIEADGEGEVIGLTTTTGNYVAWGFASKNCGNYAHYKGTRAKAGAAPEIRGLEYKRGDSTVLARKLQSDVINLILAGEEREHVYRDVVERSMLHVLQEPLDISEIVITKSLRRETADYSSKTKKDGTPAADIVHLAVAKVLQARGEEVAEGTRIAYVIAKEGPPLVGIPAADYDGSNVDRYYAWESVVYPPTFRLLQAAFPNGPWAEFEKRRPKAPKAPKKSKDQKTLSIFETRPVASELVAEYEQWWEENAFIWLEN